MGPGGRLDRCPFVRAVAVGDTDEARRLAAGEAPAVIDWLIAESRRQLSGTPEA